MFEIKFDVECIDEERARKAGFNAYAPISMGKEGDRIAEEFSEDGYFDVFIWPFLSVGLSSLDKLHSGQTVPFEMEYSDIIFECGGEVVEIYIQKNRTGNKFGNTVTVELQMFAAAMISFAKEFVAYCREKEIIEESSLQRMDEQISDVRTWYSQTYSEDLE